MARSRTVPSSILGAMTGADVVEFAFHGLRSSLGDVPVRRQGTDAIEIASGLPAAEQRHEEKAEQDPGDRGTCEVSVKLVECAL
jgi:hypothetical protein